MFSHWKRAVAAFTAPKREVGEVTRRESEDTSVLILLFVWKPVARPVSLWRTGSENPG